MFFDKFRDAISRLPAGLIRPGAPASPADLDEAEGRLGVALPAAYRAFLLSFDGADLFHENIVVAGIRADAALSLVALNADRVAGTAPELAFAETSLGDRFVFTAGGTVTRLRGGSDERILAGSDFERWLDATVARERLLYGPDGEFAPDAFEPDGEEVTPRTALRQAERALKQDPGSAEAEHERGLALRRLGRDADAVQALDRATALDPANPWPWFDLGRLLLERTSDPRRAAEVFARAAALEEGPAAARLFAWVARAAVEGGDSAAAETARREAGARHPGIADDLRRAVAAAQGDDDADAWREANDLLTALTEPGADRKVSAPRVRLPVLRQAPAPPPPPAAPRRPPPAAPRPGGGSRAGRRR